MKFANNSTRNIDWLDVAPTILHVHDMGMHPYIMRWPYVAWLALEDAGHTQASNNLEHHDVQLKAVSVALLHTEFLQELFLRSCYLPDLFFLEGITTKTETLEILEQRYWSATSERSFTEYSDEEVFLELYFYHREQIVAALLEQFSSAEALFDSLVELAEIPEDSEIPFSLIQLGSAMDFVTGLVDASEHERTMNYISTERRP